MGATIRNGNFYDDVKDSSKAIPVIGYNDPIAASWGLVDRAGNKYRNQMVPGAMSTGQTGGIYDFQTICPAETDLEYGYRVGLMLVWYYGANTLRGGDQDSWATDLALHAYASDPATWKQRLVDFCNGLWMAGCYFIYQIAGGADAENLAGPHTINTDTWHYVLKGSSGNLMSGSVLEAGTDAFNWFFGTYCKDVGNALAACPGFLYLDLFNEVDHDYLASKWWSQFGGNSPTGPRMTAVHSWAKAASDKVVESGYNGNVGIGFACEGSMWSPDWYSGHWCKDCQDAPNIHVLNYHAYSNMDAGLNSPNDQTKKRWYWQQVYNFLHSLGKPVVMSEWGYQGPVNGFVDVFYEPYRQLLEMIGFQGYQCMRLQNLEGYPHAVPNPWPTTPAFSTSQSGGAAGAEVTVTTSDSLVLGSLSVDLTNPAAAYVVADKVYQDSVVSGKKLLRIPVQGAAGQYVILVLQK